MDDLIKGENPHSWSAKNGTNANNDTQEHTPDNGQFLGGLTSVLSSTSIMSRTMDTIELKKIAEFIKNEVEGLKTTNLAGNKSSILPKVEILDSSLSPRLPGILLSMAVQGYEIIMPVFVFSHSVNELDDESIMINSFSGGMSTGAHALLRKTPVKQVNSTIFEGIVNREKENNRTKGINSVVIAGATLIDIQCFTGYNPEVKDDREMKIASFILKEWEMSVKIQIAKAMVESKVSLPQPFAKSQDGKYHPYGMADKAIARIESVNGVTQIDGVPSTSNIKVVIRTKSKNNNGGNLSDQLDIVTSYATVTLNSVPFAAYQQRGAFNNQIVGPNEYPFGYKPFQPVILLDSTQAGPHLNYNDSIYSWLLGVWGMMSLNNQYMWSEGLRVTSDNHLGSIVDLDAIIPELIQGCGNVNIDASAKLTPAKLKDLDVCHKWYRTNINAHAAFAVDLFELGSGSAINNLLMRSTDKSAKPGGKSSYDVTANVLVDHLDVLTGGEFSKIIKRNVVAQKGWFVGKDILHRSGIIVPQGVYIRNKTARPLSEVIDERYVAKTYGKETLLRNNLHRYIYGDGMIDEQARWYHLNISLPSLTGSDDNFIKNYGSRYFFDPEFITAIAEAFKTFGELQVSGTQGVYDTSNQIFANGWQYATASYAGSQGFATANGNVASYNNFGTNWGFNG